MRHLPNPNAPTFPWCGSGIRSGDQVLPEQPTCGDCIRIAREHSPTPAVRSYRIEAVVDLPGDGVLDFATVPRALDDLPGVVAVHDVTIGPWVELTGTVSTANGGTGTAATEPPPPPWFFAILALVVLGFVGSLVFAIVRETREEASKTAYVPYIYCEGRRGVTGYYQRQWNESSLVACGDGTFQDFGGTYLWDKPEHKGYGVYVGGDKR